jgi:eukaryotic-like serine/threonine-protein kinase
MMQHSVGDRIDHFEILAPIGAGGMGEVYRARDTRIDRHVAIKFANEKFSGRFEREARAISRLNHPHICTLFDVGANYLVMELVEGETLAARLEKGALPMELVLSYGAQIADALATAHAQGIVHRDLKPGNVMLPKSGVKILDFGVAKYIQTDETLTASHVIMGTPAYMAPEQLEGKPCDARTDIFALGLLLHEMATGKRLKQGERANLDNLPERFAHIIARCLKTERDDRWQSARDVKAELEWAGDTPRVLQPGAASSRMRRLLPLLSVLLGITLALEIYLRPVSPVAGLYTFRPFATEAAEENYPAWSPDGKTIAYFAEVNGVKQIFTKSLGSPAPAQITRSPGDCTNPFWSPDGARIYYLSNTGMWSVGAAGGEPQKAAETGKAAAVSSDKSFAFLRGGAGTTQLWIAPASVRAALQYRQAPFPETFARGWTIDFSRDGSKLAVLMAREGAAGFTTELWIVPFPTGSPRRVSEAMPFSLDAVPAPNPRLSWLPDNRHLVIDATIAKHPGHHLALIDTTAGTVSPITSGTGEEWAPSVSPDGEKIAFAAGRHDFDVIQVSIEGLEIRTLLGTSSREENPAWAPSGRQFAYVTDAGGGPEIWVRSVFDGWATPVLKQGLEGVPLWYTLDKPTFSPDGERIAYGVSGSKHAIWISSVAGGRPVPLDAQSYDHHGPVWSPDGNWIAYNRFFQGKWTFVKAPVGGGERVRLADSISTNDTAWSPDGEWLAFAKGASLQLVSADGKIEKTLAPFRPAAFGFSKDGSLLYLIRRGTDRSWELAAISIESGNERKVGDLRLPASAIIWGFSLHPDGKSFPHIGRHSEV